MAVTTKQAEATPATYPATPSGVSAEVSALANVIWARIESYVAHRWTEREVIWTVEGPGEWSPPLKPATISKIEIWNGTGWDDCTPDASPLGGYWLPASGPYRFTATVGSGATVPDLVSEAFKRLGNYMAANPGKPGASRESVSAGSISTDWNRSASWMALAMQNSGAGDLLRTFRKV